MAFVGSVSASAHRPAPHRHGHKCVTVYAKPHHVKKKTCKHCRKTYVVAVKPCKAKCKACKCHKKHRVAVRKAHRHGRK